MRMSEGKSGCYEFGDPAHWMRIDDMHPEDDRYRDWGIVGFQVGDIPSPLQHEASSSSTFEAVHVPLRKNYPRSEVRCFEEGKHVQATECLPPALHLRWRKQLLWKIRIQIKPGRVMTIPSDPPSHRG